MEELKKQAKQLYQQLKAESPGGDNIHVHHKITFYLSAYAEDDWWISDIPEDKKKSFLKKLIAIASKRDYQAAKNFLLGHL